VAYTAFCDCTVLQPEACRGDTWNQVDWCAPGPIASSPEEVGFEVVKEVDRSLPNWPKEYASNLCSIL
jgi:hypothetical protein